ncbi:hypothetical protein IFR05_000264 [Cadophora sp. M221]|nr:hypothetical protein IFR05_000264 [Cadophora sp. M221]
MIADFERHKSTINVALSADGLRMTLQALSRQDEISSGIQEIHNAIKKRWAMETHIALSQERGRVLAFFGKVDPRSNHEASLNLLHPLTGLWMSEGEVFQSWLLNRNSKLWLSGIPGAGKTIMAASLIEETMRRSSPKRGVAYFYCDYKDSEKQDPVNVLGSLAAQLSRQSEHAFSLLQALYSSCHPKDHPPMSPKLSDLTRTICEMTTSFDHISIIVDGLDECGNHVCSVTDSITSLASDSNTSVLVLSRDIHDIRGSLEEQYSHLDIAARSEDLKLYVAAEIETRSRKHGRGQLQIRNPQLKEHILKTLVDRADGMQRRDTVLKLLIAKGADLNLSYIDLFGQEFSCSKLALYANMTHGAGHPLVTLVAAGARLDQGLFTSFEGLVESSQYAYNLQQGYQEFIDALIDELQKSTQDDTTKTEILAAALRFKNPTGFELAHAGEDGYAHISFDKLQDIFCRAVKFDQAEVIGDLLRDPRLQLSAKYGSSQETALHIAAENECVNATEKLLSLGAEVDALSAVGLTSLQCSVAMNNQTVGCIQSLLKYGASTTLSSGTDARTVWHVAAEFDNKAALEALASEDKNMSEALEVTQSKGFIPLLYAAKNNSPAAFEVILSHTTKLPETCPKGLKLVHYVVAMNSVQLLRKIMEKGSELAEQTDDGRTALHFIPKGVDVDVVKLLIECGVSPESAAEDGVTPLHRLIYEELTEDQQVLELLTSGEAVSLLTKKSHSALHYALGFPPPGDRSIRFSARRTYVNLLVEKGIDISTRDLRGKSAVELLKCELGSHAKPGHMKEVLDAGVDVNIQLTCNGSTPLMVAAGAGTAEMVRFLLDNGADAEPKDDTGWQVIHYALNSGDPPTMKTVLELEIAWNNSMSFTYQSITFHDCNLVHMAAIITSYEKDSIKYLLESSHVSDLNCLAGNGFSALHLAAIGSRPIHCAIEFGKLSTTETLLKWGCELTADKKGFTPELYALKRKDQKLVRMLKKYQAVPAEQASIEGQIQVNSCETSQDSSKMLHLAIMQGDLDLCKTLVEAGASVNKPIFGCQGCAPILWAMTLMHIPIARYLIEKGASTIGQACSKVYKQPHHYKGYSPVHHACRSVFGITILPLLLAQDLASGGLAFQSPVTPLHIAVLCKNIGAVEIVLRSSMANSPPPTTVGTESATESDTSAILETTSLPPMPWCSSAALCDRQIEGSMLEWEWLLCYNPQMAPVLTTREIRTGSALHLAVYVDSSERVLDLILKTGANIDLLDYNGNTSLHIAISRGSATALDLLLLRGANLLLPDRRGRTPAVLASFVNSITALERLHAAGAPLDHVDDSGSNALHYARSPAVFSFLFHKGVDLYVRNYKRVTPITNAIECAETEPAFSALTCNLDIDFERCPGVISGFDFMRLRTATLKLLLRRIPQHMISTEVNSNTSTFKRGAPLSRIAKVGMHRFALLDILLKHGASMERELDDTATPLQAACKSGRLGSVKHLVLASGGNLTGTIAGRLTHAVEAAKDFPHIVQWLLVGRFTEQLKISQDAEYCASSEQETRHWSGPCLVEVALAAISPPFYGTDSRARVFQLEKLRRSLRGKVVWVTSLRFGEEVLED